jgi:hypothetical protein
MPARRARARKKGNSKRKCATNASAKSKQLRRKKQSKECYEADLPSDDRETLAEKLLLGEELAQYAFGATGSFLIGL